MKRLPKHVCPNVCAEEGRIAAEVAKEKSKQITEALSINKKVFTLPGFLRHFQ